LKNRWAESQVIWSEERIRQIQQLPSSAASGLGQSSIKQRVLALPILGPMIHWLWLLIHLRTWIIESRETRERLQHTLLRVSHYELAVRDHLLAGLSRNKQDELIYQHHLPESVYLALEERLRGSSAEVAAKQISYLPRVQMVASGLQLPVLDVGCGRGEWLAQLESVGIQARGVDLSERMVRVAEERGLQAVSADACTYLLAQEPGSLAAITAFQVVEHLPVPELWTLLEAAYKALAPGGLLLLETPNPENIQVAAYSFRLDPTHLHPLPPPLLDVLVREAGFGAIEIERRDAWPQMTEGASEYPEYLRKLLFCEQDYALLAYKLASDASSA
jgi:2-polyprenyl-3-methyl-5-hydroxy-6-metoxy-1,4-benzoquinol methylase